MTVILARIGGERLVDDVVRFGYTAEVRWENGEKTYWEHGLHKPSNQTLSHPLSPEEVAARREELDGDSIAKVIVYDPDNVMSPLILAHYRSLVAPEDIIEIRYVAHVAKKVTPS